MQSLETRGIINLERFEGEKHTSLFEICLSWSQKCFKTPSSQFQEIDGPGKISSSSQFILIFSSFLSDYLREHFLLICKKISAFFSLCQAAAGFEPFQIYLSCIQKCFKTLSSQFKEIDGPGKISSTSQFILIFSSFLSDYLMVDFC